MQKFQTSEYTIENFFFWNLLPSNENNLLCRCVVVNKLARQIINTVLSSIFTEFFAQIGLCLTKPNLIKGFSLTELDYLPIVSLGLTRWFLLLVLCQKYSLVNDRSNYVFLLFSHYRKYSAFPKPLGGILENQIEPPSTCVQD